MVATKGGEGASWPWASKAPFAASMLDKQGHAIWRGSGAAG